ncbi:lipopolysaccharide heptosyltransferase I [Candidatus Pseudothioglobus singularis]|jgi:heptosyltransferase I|nr:lipopolysaccharide heptosyltransferase I [Candidatus Pseudothioglobus singularis]
MKIAIVKLSALGDIVHTMVVLQFIKKFNNEILIDWFVDENYKELLDSNPHINQVHSVSIRQAKKNKSILILFKEFTKLRKIHSYDLVIDMQGLIKSAIVSRLIPSKVTLGFDKYSIREGFAALFYNKRFNIGYEKNVVERNFELIKYALKMQNDKKEIINKKSFLYPKINYINPNISNSKKNILIIPGASHHCKMYPFEKFAELSKLIDGNYVIIWGSSEEKLIVNKIQSLSPIVNICEKLSISELISLISQVDLVIGPDTGPTHIAWALNIPSIALFGPTPGYRNTYQTKINLIRESKSKVNPYNINKNDTSIKDIDPADIANIAQQLLG